MLALTGRFLAAAESNRGKVLHPYTTAGQRPHRRSSATDPGTEVLTRALIDRAFEILRRGPAQRGPSALVGPAVPRSGTALVLNYRSTRQCWPPGYGLPAPQGAAARGAVLRRREDGRADPPPLRKGRG
jgi:hypothetical protein